MPVLRSATDTVGEFPWATDQPESGQVGDLGGSESRSPDGPDEFANGIQCYSRPPTGRQVIRRPVVEAVQGYEMSRESPDTERTATGDTSHTRLAVLDHVSVLTWSRPWCLSPFTRLRPTFVMEGCGRESKPRSQ